MKQVFVVNSGSYSDYRINAIFSSRKLANEFMAAVKQDSYSGYNDIEVYELDPPGADLIGRGYSVWKVFMLIDGTTEQVERTMNESYHLEHVGVDDIWRRSKAPAYKGTNTPDILTAYVWAKTEQAAVKIVNEKRTQMIASGKWK